MAKWGYSGANGPENWGKNFPKANGNKQSPIDINGAAKGAMGPLAFNYVKEGKVDISNAGWNLICKLSGASSLSGGPLPGKHVLDSFHLHWAEGDANGSEHAINGKKSAAELHLCHYNSGKYSSFAEAADKDDGLCLLAVMLDIGDPLKVGNAIDSANQVAACGAKASAGGVDPNDLLPADKSKFYSYSGALTTPPCHESAQWVIMDGHMSVSSAQLKALRGLKDGDGNPIVKNCRPLCNPAGRKIAKSF